MTNTYRHRLQTDLSYLPTYNSNEDRSFAEDQNTSEQEPCIERMSNSTPLANSQTLIFLPELLQATTAVFPADIRPFRKADFSKAKKNNRSKGKTAIHTDTPEKNEIEEKYNKTKMGIVKKQIGNEGKFQKVKRTIKRKKKQQIEVETSSNEDETICLKCHGPYKNSKEDWLQCRECKNWAHSTCTNTDPLFVCINCESHIDISED